MRATAILLMAAALALPPAGATPVTLYGHVVHMGQDFPLNTQEPPSDFVVDEGIGLMTNTLTCLPATGVVNTSQGYHTMYGYSSPSFVEYGQAEDGGPRVHPERGLSADARLDAASPMVLHWYFSEPQPGELGTPAPVPNVVVQATMRTGESLSVDDRAYDEGPILAQGRSAPALLAGQSSQGVEVDTVDGRIVYHFTVPMAIEEPVIPRATGFNLRVDVFVENEVCGEDKAVMPNAVLLHSSPGHRPRLELGVLDHLQLQYIHPQVVEPDLVIHTSVLDVWGVYDVVVFKATIEGPGMPATDLQPAANVAQPHVHGQRTASAGLTWILAGGSSLPPGRYTVNLTATTVQGETQAWQAQFDTEAGPEAPGVSVGWLGLALALALLARRRP